MKKIITSLFLMMSTCSSLYGAASSSAAAVCYRECDSIPQSEFSIILQNWMKEAPLMVTMPSTQPLASLPGQELSHELIDYDDYGHRVHLKSRHMLMRLPAVKKCALFSLADAVVKQAKSGKAVCVAVRAIADQLVVCTYVGDTAAPQYKDPLTLVPFDARERESLEDELLERCGIKRMERDKPHFFQQFRRRSAG